MPSLPGAKTNDYMMSDINMAALNFNFVIQIDVDPAEEIRHIFDDI